MHTVLLPVGTDLFAVLIPTSRSSEADRQRGLEVGADGCLKKSGFDEAGLLTDPNRLLGARV